MITLSIEICNTQKIYDGILSSIQFHQLTCTCGHSACLAVHGYYLRGLKSPDGIIHLFPGKTALRSLLDRIPCIDENNVKYIMRSYLRHWKQRLLSCTIPLCPLKELVSRCFSSYCRQFMQVKRTPNILFRFTT